MPRWAPEPPVPLPPGCVVHVPGRGELFVRDSGGDGPPCCCCTAGCSRPTSTGTAPTSRSPTAGYRVLAVDHRGHGRGLRTPEPFPLSACADDAAALVAHLKIPPVLAVGYSMGGPIASLLARDHPQLGGRRRARRHRQELERPADADVLAHHGRPAAGDGPRARVAVAARAAGRRLPRVADHHVDGGGAHAAATRSTSPRPAASWAATTRAPGSPASTRPAR